MSASPNRDSLKAESASNPRLRLSLILALGGLFVLTVGAKPNFFGWDRSPVVGFVQIIVFLIGLAGICVGGYIGLAFLWRDAERTIIYDIGSRLVATGFVCAVFAGLADIAGMGSHTFPNVPYFGPWQATGVMISQGIIAFGFLMMIPFKRK